MAQLIHITENAVRAVFKITDDGRVRLLHMAHAAADRAEAEAFPDVPGYGIVQVKTADYGYEGHHGAKHITAGLSERLRYVSHADTRSEDGSLRTLAITQQADGLYVTSHFVFYRDTAAVRLYTTVENRSDVPVTLELVSSFMLFGISKEGAGAWDTKCNVSIPHNKWYGEAQWYSHPVIEMGLARVGGFSVKPLIVSSTGTFATDEYLPAGYFENTASGTSLMWQIEHNGSWMWEIGDEAGELYLLLSGPNQDTAGWWKTLAPGESFESVPAAVAFSAKGFDGALAEMTRYRRAIRRENRDNKTLPVIFNDFMNCLGGDPTTEKLYPLIDAAAKAGCEYYCIDCGWYSDGPWWNNVGEWLPSKARFPGGIREPLDYIRSKGMIPGLWLEIEVMGIVCPLAAKLPDDWFFLRHGKRVIDHERYQLDFANPAVRDYATGVIDRLVNEYGVGYIKMDYNIEAGIGTERDCESFGEGLLRHNRAYLAWLDGIFAKYPDLIIESCSSGAMRATYALLSRHSIQSSSDQTDYRMNAVVAAASSAGICPEQCAVWAYPLRDADVENVAMNMINAMLTRIHQSGHLAQISPEGFDMVAEGIAVYKQIRGDIPHALPVYPTGMPHFLDDTFSFGLRCGDHLYLAVWNVSDKEAAVDLPLDVPAIREATCIYPAALDTAYTFEGSRLRVTLKGRTARLFRVEC
jgi:alpha-galactosidase